jgi:hypothetical protein
MSSGLTGFTPCEPPRWSGGWAIDGWIPAIDTRAGPVSQRQREARALGMGVGKKAFEETGGYLLGMPLNSMTAFSH